MEEKTCRKCGHPKTLTEFWVSGKRKDGSIKRNPDCRACLAKNKKTLPNKGGHSTPNRYRVDGDTAYIELTDRQDNTVAEAMISTCDLERVIAAGRWHRGKAKRTFYVFRSYRKDGKNHSERLHRLIMQPPADLVVDHIDHDGLDDRRDKLRVVTHKENGQNIRPPSTICDL